VHLVPSLGGSYEGCPPTLGDIITRDRRWAQGNLQHGRIITAYGLPFLSRVHLAMGMVSYLASPLWALTLLVGVALAFQAAFTTPSYFGSEVSLFPKWPVFDAQTALALFVATMLVVHLPKVLGGVWALRNASQRRRHGGVLRLIGAIVVESVLSTLIAPILVVTQTSAVVAVLMGRDAGWRAQARIGSRSSFSSYCRRYFWQLVWGTVAGSVCLAISPAVLAWMSPIVAGLLLAPATGYWTSHRAGPVLSRLLMTAEDRHPPACLRHLSA
jgi:membrane glycosyltransferase